MTRKSDKVFDCVEMKRNVQNALRDEYESRKSEFGSYAEFLGVKATEEQWQQDLLTRIHAGAGSDSEPDPPSRNAGGR